MRNTVMLPGPRAYSQGLARNRKLAMIPVSMAAALLEVEVATVQGYIRRGLLEEIVVGPGRAWVGVSADGVRAMRLGKLRQIRGLAKVAEPILLQAAKARTTIEYGADLMKPLGLDHQYARDRDMIGKVLGSISTRTYRRDNRLLSVLAVRKDTGMPNTVFFDLARDLGAMSRTKTDEHFFRHEKKAVFDAYC